MDKVDYKAEVLKKYPNAFCKDFLGLTIYLHEIAVWGIGNGETEDEAWVDAYGKLVEQGYIQSQKEVSDGTK